MSVSSSHQPLRVLVIYYHPDEPSKTRPAFTRHLRVLEYCDCRHEITYHNVYDYAPYWIGADHVIADREMQRLRRQTFDAVILHYSFLSVRTVGAPFFDWMRRFKWIAELECPKVALPMDEGDCHEILDEWLFLLNVSIVFSVHYRPERPLYSHLRSQARIHPCFPGYVDLTVGERCGAARRPIADRARDVVYRARRLPFRFGHAGQLKHRVGEVFRERATGLVMDISTDPTDAIFGEAWIDFLASSRTVVGTEGGYSAIDWRGEVKTRIDSILRDDPGASFESVSERMPAGWDDYCLLTITPRHFEAAVARTAQILVEGEYRGILLPNQHYIPLRADFSNLPDVVDRIHDGKALQEMVCRTYEEICRSDKYSYTAFAREIDAAIRNEFV